jgi:hypothetical protein
MKHAILARKQLVAVPAKRSAGLSMRQAIGQPMQNSSTTKSPNRSISLLTGWHRDANELK